MSDIIRNNISSICNTAKCTIPQRKTVNQIINGLLRKGTPLLRQIGDRKTSTAKKEGERFGKHLENIDMTTTIKNFVSKKVLPLITENDTIAYDLTDIAEKTSKGVSGETGKGMEWVTDCFDGSKRRKSKGIMLHGVGVKNFLLRLQVHNSNTDFLPHVRKEIITEIIDTIGTQGIWAFDRGNDDQQLFQFLNDQSLKFIVRLKENRIIIQKNTGERLKVGEMKPGRYEVNILDASGKVNTKHTYLLVIQQHCKKYKDSIRLLCSTNLKEFSDATLVEKYLERWGVEKSFREIKNTLHLEKIQIMKRKRFENMIALIQFSSVLSRIIFQKTQEAVLSPALEINISYKQYIKKESLTVNICSFSSFLRIVLPRKYVSPWVAKDEKMTYRLHFGSFVKKKWG